MVSYKKKCEQSNEQKHFQLWGFFFLIIFSRKIFIDKKVVNNMECCFCFDMTLLYLTLICSLFSLLDLTELKKKYHIFIERWKSLSTWAEQKLPTIIQQNENQNEWRMLVFLIGNWCPFEYPIYLCCNIKRNFFLNVPHRTWSISGPIKCYDFQYG